MSQTLSNEDQLQKFVNTFQPQGSNPTISLVLLKDQVSLSHHTFDNFHHLLSYYKNHFLRKTINRVYWHEKDRYILTWCLEQLILKDNPSSQLPVYILLNYTNLNALQQEEHFQKLSELLNLDKESIFQRWMTIIKTKVQDFPFSKEEDDIIIQLKQQGLTWEDLLIEFNRMAKNRQCQVIRNVKQIKERWTNQLNPDMQKGIWDQEDSIKLCELVGKHGYKWRFIAQVVNNRNESQVKNHFHSIINHLRRYLKIKFGEKKLISLICQYRTTNPNEMLQHLKGLKKKQKQYLSEQHSVSSSSSFKDLDGPILKVKTKRQIKLDNNIQQTIIKQQEDLVHELIEQKNYQHSQQIPEFPNKSLEIQADREIKKEIDDNLNYLNKDKIEVKREDYQEDQKKPLEPQRQISQYPYPIQGPLQLQLSTQQQFYFDYYYKQQQSYQLLLNLQYNQQLLLQKQMQANQPFKSLETQQQITIKPKLITNSTQYFIFIIQVQSNQISQQSLPTTNDFSPQNFLYFTQSPYLQQLYPTQPNPILQNMKKQ